MSKLKFPSVRKLLASRKDLMLPAFLGDRSGTVKADTNNNVYVTLFNGEVFTVQNNRVPNVPRLPVVIGYEAGNKTLLQVLRTRDVFEASTYPDIPEHAKANHEWPGVDTLWVRGEQFIPGLAVPVTGLTVQVFGFVYYLTAWQVLPTQEIDLTASLPTTGALFVLVEVDDAGVISLRDGTPVASREVLTYADIPLPATDKKPLFAVKMYAGQSSVIKSRLETDIIDLRFAGFGTGGGGGGSAPTTTAINDFQVGDGSGNWITKTLAQVITILRTSLDSIYQAAGSYVSDAASDSVYYVRRNAAWTNAKTYFDTLYAALSHTHAASDIASGTIATARLGSGSASSTTYLRGDQTWVTVTAGREILTAARTYYVRTDGSDSNNGLANTSGGAFLTVQKAVDTAYTLDTSIYDVTIQVANGTYTTAVSISGTLVGKGSLTIQGNSGTPANVLISITSNQAITVNNYARVTIKDFEIRTTTSGIGLYVITNATAYFSNIRWGACATQHMQALNGSIVCQGNYTISGGSIQHWAVATGGLIQVQGYTVTLSGTPAFSGQFAQCTVLGSILCGGGTSFSGSATGTRYYVASNAVINTGGGGASFLPGNAAGSTSTGGQYL